MTRDQIAAVIMRYPYFTSREAENIADAILAAQQHGAIEALAKRCFTMSEPYLSGYRLVLGFNTLADVQAAHKAVTEIKQDALEPT